MDCKLRTIKGNKQRRKRKWRLEIAIKDLLGFFGRDLSASLEWVSCVIIQLPAYVTFLCRSNRVRSIKQKSSELGTLIGQEERTEELDFLTSEPKLDAGLLM
ncbi:hypothetical protein WMY93_026076 [Mugilogobius chulae]|uniref:Uncharacterized protein n=1 Tax=Mugilogobius chulae TaxID=88201 RepID=A0AAW0N0Q8_9GOBI